MLLISQLQSIFHRCNLISCDFSMNIFTIIVLMNFLSRHYELKHSNQFAVLPHHFTVEIDRFKCMFYAEMSSVGLLFGFLLLCQLYVQKLKCLIQLLSPAYLIPLFSLINSVFLHNTE